VAEANGYVIVKASEEIMQMFLTDVEEVSFESMSALFQHAGIDSIQKSHSLLSFIDENDVFSVSEIELIGGYLRISIFGDEWMPLCQVLVKSGRNVEIYGKINHEHGVDEYYVLNDEGESYFEFVDYESDLNVEREEEIAKRWLELAPNSLKDDLSGWVDLDEDMEDEDEDEDHIWSPSEDSDYVRNYKGLTQINTELFMPEHYDKKHLQKAIDLGAQLVDPSPHGWRELPYSELVYVISSLEIDAQTKTRIVLDMLDCYEFDLGTVYQGYGNAYGTPLSLAADNGLLTVVNCLIKKGADPDFDGDYCALEAAKSTLNILPAICDYEDLEHQGSSENLKEIIIILEKMKKGEN